MANAQKIRETVALIRADLDHYDQDAWVQTRGCGTTMCFAGWALKNDGWEPYFSPNSLSRLTDKFVKDHQIREVFETARDVLELTEGQASKIFYYFPSEEALDEDEEYGSLPPAEQLRLVKERITEVTGVTFDVVDSTTN